MNRQQRSNLIEFQPRSFNSGTVEYINSQWVFFDEETDEAALVEEFIHQEVEVQRNSKWCKGFLLDNGSIQTGNETISLIDQEMIRIRKQLIYSFERLLDELNDEAFVQFIHTLNSLNFSIYDCIYCYNHLTFLDHETGRSGVNFLIFDNEEYICSVQHHFDYFEIQNDRFELTLNNGKRTVIERIS
ncbi:DUF2777 domain-containing protein [Bacillus sp. ISL-35]|uniref:DUF2777 domain-containing protein n=1 Tax=Bacillus sp. ISL-35 TaxID=2819122 RepID=UPI001BE63E37|nr:DUF2777 domain-containing protein [Bacillus sp. ISL-35]MBT2678149.1 DUF2777 domain-containing protein [Bacillus sp. ISL-35]MBT2702564.1 DUF2777 domain-containing protein [Chryseobacterium sp. ISL-80]